MASILAACSPEETAQDPVATTTPDEGVEPTPAEVMTLVYGADDLVAEEFEPRRMNARSDFSYGFLVYDSLMWMDEDGEVSPGIAESYEPSDDGLTWTFTLRPMEFHDGSAVTAEDVVFAFEQMLSEDSITTNRSVWVAAGTTAEAVDERTVVVRTEQPFAELLFASTPRTAGETFVFPKAYYEEVGADGFRDAPIGTGPWRFVSRTPGDRFEFEAVKDHPWRAPSFDALVYRLVPEEATKVASLLAGEIDAALVSFDSLPQLEAAGFQIVSIPDTRQAVLAFFGVWDPRIEGMPISDVRVREALTIALNVEEMIDTIWAGLARPAQGDVERLAPIYGEFDRPAIPFDPDRSQQLMSEAGYPDGFDMRLFSAPGPGAPWGGLMAEAVAAYWAAIGVNAEIVPIDSGTLSEMTQEEELHEDLIGSALPLSSTTLPASIVLPRTARANTGYRTMLDPDVIETMGQALVAPDLETRDALIRESVAMWYDHWASPVLAYVPSALALGPRIADFDVPGFGNDMVSAWPDRMVREE